VQWSVQTYAEFMAALYALMTVEAITLTEANDFQNQMLNVLGHDPVPLSARVTGLPSVWRGEPHVFVESPLRSLAGMDRGCLNSHLGLLCVRWPRQANQSDSACLRLEDEATQASWLGTQYDRHRAGLDAVDVPGRRPL
jgi:hypothetical protein